MELYIKYPGIVETLNYLVLQIKDSLDFAGKFIKKYNIKTPEQLFNTFKKLITYKNDPKGTEYIQSFQTFAKNGFIGDCDCFTVASCACLYMLGYKTGFVLQARQKNYPRHIFSAYFDKGKWKAFDLTNRVIHYHRDYPLTQLVTI
jgi:hypothetical protein